MSLLILSVIGYAGAAVAQEPAAGVGGTRVDVVKGSVLNDGEAIIVPNVLLHVSVDGSLFVAKQGSGATAQAKARYAVDGFTREMLQGLAHKIQDDLIGRLRSSGYAVKTWEDIRDHPEVAKWERMEIDKDYGMPIDDDPGVTWAVATPSDAQAIKHGLTGPVWKFRGIAKEQNLVVIVPQFWIVAPQVWGEKGSGYKSVSAKVNVAPGLNLHGAFAWILNPKGGGGSVKLTEMMVNLTENAGRLEQVDPRKSEAGSTVTAGVMGTPLGAGRISRRSASYVLTVDQEAYMAAVLKGATAFNQAIADAAVRAKGK